MFQSTRPRGARLMGTFNTLTGAYVSIHAPAWGATKHRARHENLDLRFNPRARVGRDCLCQPGRRDRYVSIHAPAWGATAQYNQDIAKTKVSIHAPAWGATELSCIDVLTVLFQSTRPRGARLNLI